MEGHWRHAGHTNGSGSNQIHHWTFHSENGQHHRLGGKRVGRYHVGVHLLTFFSRQTEAAHGAVRRTTRFPHAERSNRRSIAQQLSITTHIQLYCIHFYRTASMRVGSCVGRLEWGRRRIPIRYLAIQRHAEDADTAV